MTETSVLVDYQCYCAFYLRLIVISKNIHKDYLYI